MSKQHVKEDELTCKPLDTYEEVMMFFEFPPPWRTLCKELTPHSKSMLKNMEINNHYDTFLDLPQTFCHFDPDAEDIIRRDEKTLPKTLVCHDMANGYHDDSYIDGTTVHDAYTFYNWAGIDIFCYFSHHLVTIPPLGWINVGHAHGVKVIGTLITEWSEGIAFWDKVLQSEQHYENFASALVTITKTLKFDGWLLNVENKIAKPAVLLDFLRYLNRILHQEIPHGVLIWYDSVTIHGTLNWQNGLNEKNKAYFDACDGIFTNYSWTELDVEESVKFAGDRVTDLYIGIDIWGRNFLGGGQFNTQAAVKVAFQKGCSLAIFAPAWTHEAMSTKKGDINSVAIAEGLDSCQQFMLRDRALWGSLWPFLNTRVPSTLPFRTSFCRGLGKKRRFYGEVLCNSPWYNLRHQQYQPNSAHGPHGYLLSTQEAILKHSTHLAKGILHYRESFQMSRIGLHSTKCFLKDINLVEEEEENENEHVETPMKRKLKDYLKHLLHMKSPRLESTSPALEEAAEAGPSTKPEGKGHSMMQMSVSLKLGQTGKRQRYGLACVPEEHECLEVYQDDSFIGGSCLRINPTDSICPEHRMTRLFHCDFLCENSFIVCVVTKKLNGFAEQSLNIVLFMENARKEYLRIVLIGRNLAQAQQLLGSHLAGNVNVYPLDMEGPNFREVQKYLLLNQSGFYVPVENSFNWKVRYYEMNLPGCRVSSINLRTGLEQGPILLGHFGICHRPREQIENEIDSPTPADQLLISNGQLNI